MPKPTRQTPSDQTWWGHHCCSPPRGPGPPQESALIPFAMLPAQSSFKNRYELLLPETWNASTFSYSSHYTEYALMTYIYNKCKNTWEVERKYADLPGTVRSKGRHPGGYPGFSFGLLYPALDTNKPTYRKHQQAQTGSPDQGLSLL